MGKSRSSEKLISKHCSDIGATAAEPDEDIFGWDLFVQFPQEPFSGAEEDRPERHFAYVQVKSTERGKASAKIKLSNAQEAATSSAPWFFFMVMQDETIRAIHLWGDRHAEWLKLVRRAGVAGKVLHSEKFTLSFSKKTQIDGNVADWMRREIRMVGGNYAQAKKRLIDNLGYENGGGTGSISFSDLTRAQIASTFLGLKKGVPVSGFSFTKRRFDIPDANPVVDGASGKITFDARPAGDCNLRVQGQTGEPPINVKCQVYAFKFPNAPADEGYLRISAPPLEIFRAPNGHIETKLTFERDMRYSLRQWLFYEKLTRWADMGALDVRISKLGHALMGGKMVLDAPDQAELEVLALAIRNIDEAVRISGAVEPSFSEADFDNSFADIERFYLALQPDLSVLYPQDEEVPTFNKMICRTKIDFDHLAIHCFVMRDVVSDQIVDGQRVFTAGPARIAEAHIYDRANDTGLAEVMSDYGAFSDNLAEMSVVLNFGNLNASIKQIPHSN